MDKSGVKQLMKILSVAYPTIVKGKSQQEMQEIMSLYYDMFKEYPEEAVVIALKNYIKYNKYPPKDNGACISGIQEHIDKLMEQNTDEELWAAITKALKNGIYHAAEEFEKLPQECKSFIGSAKELQDMAQMDAGTINSVTKGQFLKNISSIKDKQKIQCLPEAELIKKLAEENDEDF